MANNTRRITALWRNLHPRLRVAKKKRAALLRHLRIMHKRTNGYHFICSLRSRMSALAIEGAGR